MADIIKRGLDWYKKEMKKEEKSYKYHNLMTLMEQEFNIDLLHYQEWKKSNLEIAQVYEELSNLRDK
jgi:hypothetical protein